MSRIDNLVELWNSNRIENQNTTTTSTINGVATSNSENGFVDVFISDNTITYNDTGTEVPLSL